MSAGGTGIFLLLVLVFGIFVGFEDEPEGSPDPAERCGCSCGAAGSWFNGIVPGTMRFVLWV